MLHFHTQRTDMEENIHVLNELVILMELLLKVQNFLAVSVENI